MSAELEGQLARVLPHVNICQAYALTETGMCLAIALPLQEKATPGCAGVIVPGVTARIIKTDGAWATFNEPGELIVRAPGSANGYYNNAKA